MKRTAYLVVSSLILVIALAAVIHTSVHPPEQHGRGMGAALFAIYVVIGGGVAALNFFLALALWIRGVMQPPTKDHPSDGDHP